MHRGSSKGGDGPTDPPEALPLSATRRPLVDVAVERGGRSTERSIPLEPDDTVRTVLGRVGLAAEGCAVFRGGRSIPLDAHVSAGDRLEVVPTFSGG